MAEKDVTTKQAELLDLSGLSPEFQDLLRRVAAWYLTLEQGEKPPKPEMAAKKETPKIHPERVFQEYLIDRLHSTQWPIKSLFTLLDTFAFDDEDFQPVLLIFKPLLERQKAELEKIEEVITRTLGEISITVCREYVEVDGKHYYKGDYLKADLEPQDEPEGGEA